MPLSVGVFTLAVDDTGAMAQEPTVTLTLTHDEALVLFEWSHRHEDENYKGSFFIDRGEQVAVWNLAASLEPLLVEPFDPNYSELVSAAKVRLVGERPMTVLEDEGRISE